MRIVFQLIENHLGQRVPAIVITTDTRKYVVNVPSSFQRFTREHRTKLPTGAVYFFTKISTETTVGLTGLLLTLFDGGYSSGTQLFVNNAMFRYMEELRYKMGFKVAPISYCTWDGLNRKGVGKFQKVQELSQRPDFAEIFGKLDCFIEKELSPGEQNNAGKQLKAPGCYENEEIKVEAFHVSVQGQNITNLIFRPRALPGKLLAEKLKQFGLKGKVVGQLQKQGRVQIGGRVITLGEVKEEDTPSPVFLILHYTCIEGVRAVLSHQIFQQYVGNKDNFTLSVIHIAEREQIVTSEPFRELLSYFDKQVEHIVFNRGFKNEGETCEQVIRSSAQVQLVSQLSTLFPICMPNLLKQHQLYWASRRDSFVDIGPLFPNLRVQAYRRNYQMIVSPRKSWGYRQIQGGEDLPIELNNYWLGSEVKAEGDIAEKLKEFDPRVIFLGTGSMKPSKYRNVSSILLDLGGQNYFMLDCGEGSYIQLANHYGLQKLQEVVLGLRTIFITHIHSDHNLGILDLISQRLRLLKKYGRKDKLFLIIPSNMVPWFHAFCEWIQDLKQGCEIVFIQSLRQESLDFEGTMSKEKAFNKFDRKCSVKSEMVEEQEQDQSQQEDQNLSFIKPQWVDLLKQYNLSQQQIIAEFQQYLRSLKIVKFLPVPVIHCPQSYGIVIEHASSIKISYSGDTRPVKQFAEAAIHSTLLIHEATFGDDLQQNAESHFHSTVGEAIDIGMAAQSWKTALTHFSQRYKSASDIVDPKIYKSNPQKAAYAQNHTIVCFDHMQMKLSETPIMPSYSRALAQALPKDNKE